MASLCLPNSELHVGLHWRGSAALSRALSDPARPAALLYPGDGAVDVVASPPRGPVTLVVVDGTWAQTKKVVRENPELAALPRYAFRPPAPSEYRIRREPRAEYLSTIEALAHVLGVFEEDPARFETLLAPFRAMVDAQLDCEARFHNTRVRRRRARPPAPEVPAIPELLRDPSRDVLCVYGEANAWPYRTLERSGAYEDELIHWVACRLSTGETFDALVAPRHPLAPGTPGHVGLKAGILARGVTVSELLERWRAFADGADGVCSWGCYATSLFVAAGGILPAERLDLRREARIFAKGKVGTLEEFVARLGGPAAVAAAPGRAPLRLAQITAIARAAQAGWTPTG
jgi:hypothetical protein